MTQTSKLINKKELPIYKVTNYVRTMKITGIIFKIISPGRDYEYYELEGVLDNEKIGIAVSLEYNTKYKPRIGDYYTIDENDEEGLIREKAINQLDIKKISIDMLIKTVATIVDYKDIVSMTSNHTIANGLRKVCYSSEYITKNPHIEIINSSEPEMFNQIKMVLKSSPVKIIYLNTIL